MAKIASFQTQGRLLQELGERLVARADVALTELIKNAYDADATRAEVTFEDARLVVSDDGHGMSESEFLQKWMQIATPDKQRNRVSRRFGRTVTGSKGIGRFAVRFLGSKLHLQTTAIASGGKRQRLTVEFDWPKIDKQPELQKVEIPYQVENAPSNAKTGTVLTISRLRADPSEALTKELRTNLLSIANPYAGLSKGRFDRSVCSSDTDPGFNIILPGAEETGDHALVTAILENAYATLTIDCTGTSVKYEIVGADGRVLLSKRLRKRTTISGGFFADIRYFPRRKGMFVGGAVDGRKAWKWIGDDKNNGIGIVDHGFRIRPYGFGENDWLQLSYDAAHRSREWRTAITPKLVTMPKGAKSDSKSNPMLYLPGFHQIIGAVFVESQPSDDGDGQDLTPSMDREGFVDNEAFRDLREIVRAGLELLAYADHQEQRRLAKRKRQKEAREFRRDVKEAIDFVDKVPGLAKSDRKQVTERFAALSKELDDKEKYFRLGEQKLEMMGLLGVLAGFITHEMDRVLHELKDLLRVTKKLETKDASVKPMRERIEASLDTVNGQLDYASGFVNAVHKSGGPVGEYSARGAATMITKHLKSFTDDRGVNVDVQIPNGVKVPGIPQALYHGVAMNLFTNAVKAAIGGQSASRDPRVVIKSWSDDKNHYLEVADNGVGIPPSIEERIWDPLFTTTSAGEFNPLGSGMGLGLTLVKKLVKDYKGKIALVEPPPGFSTCFRVSYPAN